MTDFLSRLRSAAEAAKAERDDGDVAVRLSPDRVLRIVEALEAAQRWYARMCEQGVFRWWEERDLGDRLAALDREEETR